MKEVTYHVLDAVDVALFKVIAAEGKGALLLHRDPNGPPDNPGEYASMCGCELYCWNTRHRQYDARNKTRERVAVELLYRVGVEKSTEDFEEWGWADFDSLLTELDEIVVLPLCMYEHGGVTYSSSPFGDRFDSGRLGWVVAEIEEGGTRAQALARAEYMVTYLNHCANGAAYTVTEIPPDRLKTAAGNMPSTFTGLLSLGQDSCLYVGDVKEVLEGVEANGYAREEWVPVLVEDDMTGFERQEWPKLATPSPSPETATDAEKT